MPTLFIAGAGCSLGTLACIKGICPPVAANFVSELEKRGWVNAYPELAKVIKHAKKTHPHVGLEQLWTCIDLHAKFPGAFPISWEPRGPVVRELKSALVRIYGSSCDEISENISATDACTVVEIAKEIAAGDTLISFNYDTMIERVVKRIAKAPLRHGKDLRPETIRFAKPHGSTSWQVKNLPYCVTDGEPIYDSLAHEAVRCRADLDPLLLGAVPLKSELIFEVQEYYGSQRVFEVICEQWRTVTNAVASATRIVVLGYSFPKEDLYGRFFLNEGKAMRDDNLSLKIEVFNLSADAVEPVGELFPSASSVCFKGPISAAKFCTV